MPLQHRNLSTLIVFILLLGARPLGAEVREPEIERRYGQQLLQIYNLAPQLHLDDQVRDIFSSLAYVAAHADVHRISSLPKPSTVIPALSYAAATNINGHFNSGTQIFRVAQASPALIWKTLHDAKMPGATRLPISPLKFLAEMRNALDDQDRPGNSTSVNFWIASHIIPRSIPAAEPAPEQIIGWLGFTHGHFTPEAHSIINQAKLDAVIVSDEGTNGKTIEWRTGKFAEGSLHELLK